ncbi:MAG: hypothetical protein KatS3mg131_3506 [Candidatus Tectimicrobiota bacterium]|nr:MAG: hypothetical protein KatS3mg131_3506 [Candidatus Tectomicrobia bacterium]
MTHNWIASTFMLLWVLVRFSGGSHAAAEKSARCTWPEFAWDGNLCLPKLILD